MARWDPNDLMWASRPEGTAAGRHPYAPMEQLTKGAYLLEVIAISKDGFTPAEITDVDVVVDVPDVIHTQGSVEIGSTSTTIQLPPGKFQVVKAAQVTVRDDPERPRLAVTAKILFRDKDFIMVQTLDVAGRPTAGIVDLIVVGY